MEAATAGIAPSNGFSHGTGDTRPAFPPTVRFGGEQGVEVNVYPQPHAWVENHLGAALRGVVSQQDDSPDIDSIDLEGVFASFGARRYDVLAVLIPQLPKRLPKWQFMGFDSEEQMSQGGEPSEEALRSTATYPEMIDAFKLAWKINRLGEIVGPLSKLLDPTQLKPIIRLELMEWAKRRHSTPSANSPSPSGESPQTDVPADSGTSAPTSPQTEA